MRSVVERSSCRPPPLLQPAGQPRSGAGVGVVRRQPAGGRRAERSPIPRCCGRRYPTAMTRDHARRAAVCLATSCGPSRSIAPAWPSPRRGPSSTSTRLARWPPATRTGCSPTCSPSVRTSTTSTTRDRTATPPCGAGRATPTSSDPSHFLADVGLDTVGSAEIIVFGVSVIVIRASTNPIVELPNSIVQYHKDTGELLNGSIDTGDDCSLSNLRYDGRYLYWLKNGALRRNDTTNGNLVDACLNGPIESLYVYGYEEQCGPTGCELLFAHPLLAGQPDLRGRDDQRPGVSGLHQPVNPAEITGIERGPIHYYFIERRPPGGFEGRHSASIRLGVGDYRARSDLRADHRQRSSGYDGFRTDFTWLYFRDVRAQQAVAAVELRGRDSDPRPARDRSRGHARACRTAPSRCGLIANKRTIVRFYARSGSGTGCRRRCGLAGRVERVRLPRPAGAGERRRQVDHRARQSDAHQPAINRSSSSCRCSGPPAAGCR